MLMQWRGGLVAALCFCAGLAAAAGLQVAPVTLTIPPGQNADGIWLSNTGDGPLDAQVRVFRWTQEGGKDTLTPTRELLASPPMLQLPLQGRPLIRVIRAQAPPGGPGAVQAAYRLLIDELPPARSEAQKGLQFVMRHSVPVFVQPAGAAPAPAQLAWQLWSEGERAVLQVSNSGASMRWTLKVPAASLAQGSWKAMINGNTLAQDVVRSAGPAP